MSWFRSSRARVLFTSLTLSLLALGSAVAAVFADGAGGSFPH
jgi:hypothetical protein